MTLSEDHNHKVFAINMSFYCFPQANTEGKKFWNYNANSPHDFMACIALPVRVYSSVYREASLYSEIYTRTGRPPYTVNYTHAQEGLPIH